MSEYTREEILKLIEENGGPEGLDLSGKDLFLIQSQTSAIDCLCPLERWGSSNFSFLRHP